MFQNSTGKFLSSRWSKLNAIVFLSLVVSLLAIQFSNPAGFPGIAIARNILGAYALLFPVGWMAMALLFPLPKKISLLARILLSISLSIAINNIALLAIAYVFPLPFSVSLNVWVLLFFGTVFFAAWAFNEWRKKNGQG